MHLEAERIQDTLMIRLSGELDLAVADQVKKSIDELMEEKKTSILILDVGRVTFIDSSGLGVILGRYKRMLAKKGEMYIIRAAPNLLRLFEISGVTKLVKVFESEKQILREKGKEEGMWA